MQKGQGKCKKKKELVHIGTGTEASQFQGGEKKNRGGHTKHFK